MHVFIMKKIGNKIVFIPKKKKNPLLPRLSKCNSPFDDSFLSGKQVNNLQEPYCFQRKCILR